MKKRLLTVLAALTIAGSMLSGLATAESRDVNFGIQGGKLGMKNAARTGIVYIAVERGVDAEVLLKDENGSTLATGEKKKGTTNTYVLKVGKELAGTACEIVVKPKASTFQRTANNAESVKSESSKTVLFPKR